MTPEYIEELADTIDSEKLWRLSGIDQRNLPPEKKKQLDAGVALRRYASHMRRLRNLGQHQSLLITPLSVCGYAIKSIDTPLEHQKLRRTNTP